MKKKLSFLVLITFCFLGKVNADTILGGYYECWKGGTKLSTSNFEIQNGSDLNVRCTTSGWTNMNFYVEFVDNGYATPNGTVLDFSWTPSYPLGFTKGFDIANENSSCLISESRIVCPATTNSAHRSTFAIFGDGGTYWHVLKKFSLATASDSSALANYQSQESQTNSIINNQNSSTEEIINNQNSNNQEIIDNQNANNQELIENMASGSEAIKYYIDDVYHSYNTDPNYSLTTHTFKVEGTINEVADGSSYNVTIDLATNPKATLTPSIFNSDQGIYDLAIESLGSGNLVTRGGITRTMDLYRITFRFNAPNNNVKNFDFSKKFNLAISRPNSTNNAILVVRNITATKSGSTEDIQQQQVQTSKGILGKIGDIFTSIANLPGLIWDKLKAGFDAITNSLSVLQNAIKGFFETLLKGILDGLKMLFVPTDEQLYEIINDSKDLSENFGFVGESINFFINIFTSLLGMVNANGCVELPEFRVPMSKVSLGGSDVVFWEKQNVCLNDNVILRQNIDTIRTITSIGLVCLFINFAARKFFHILSKNENDLQEGSVNR